MTGKGNVSLLVGILVSLKLKQDKNKHEKMILHSVELSPCLEIPPFYDW